MAGNRFEGWPPADLGPRDRSTAGPAAAATGRLLENGIQPRREAVRRGSELRYRANTGHGNRPTARWSARKWGRGAGVQRGRDAAGNRRAEHGSPVGYPNREAARPAAAPPGEDLGGRLQPGWQAGSYGVYR